MTLPYSICSRIASGLALLTAAALLGGCVTISDPEYDGVLAAARTDCRGNEIVGVWSSTSPLYREKAVILLFRPDGTGLRRSIPTNSDVAATTRQFLWRYQGAGIWTSGTATYRFAGNALASEVKGGAPSSAVGAIHYVFVRAGNESLENIMSTSTPSGSIRPEQQAAPPARRVYF